MKRLIIIILLSIMVLTIPVDAFCQEHNFDANSHQHHCVLACFSCNNVVVPDVQMIQSSIGQSPNIALNCTFHYQEPILDQIHRPPISSI